MRYLLTTLATLVCVICYAQSIPVDPLTGKATISIPIWEITESNLSVPISVVYSGGGVRVTEGEGSAGMSWNLIADGAVGRELRGLPDDYTAGGGDTRKGWLYNSLATTINGFTSTGSSCSTEGSDYTFIDNLGYGNDTEPDVFHFSAPGLSGSFVFGTDGLPKPIPYQDLKFEITRSGGTGPIDQIKITNNVGVAYVFNDKETTKRKAFQLSTWVVPVKLFKTDFLQYQTELSYTSSWKLASITSPSGASIYFGYESLTPFVSTQKVVTINTAGADLERYRIKNEIESSRRLTTITANSVTALFDWDQNRISNVTIKDADLVSEKGFNFVYKAIKDEAEAGESIRRSFLSEIRREENCATMPSYKFAYTGINFSNYTCPIPFEDQIKQDYWGYYNGVATTTDPAIYYYSSQTNAERFRLFPIPGQTPTTTYTGANRAVNTSAITTGSLYTITYPTGATATITFEASKFYDAVAARSYYGGGVRVQNVTISGVGKGSENIVTNYEYKLANDSSSGKLIYRPMFAYAGGDSVYRSPDNMAPDGGIFYSRTTVKQTAKGRTVYEFRYPAVYPETTYSSDWTSPIVKTARPTSCSSIGNQEIGYYMYPFAPNTNYDFEQGQILKVSDYSESGTLVRQKSYNYGRLSTTAVTLKGLRFEPMTSGNFLFSQYKVLANLQVVSINDTTKIADELTPANKIQTVSTYVYNSTHHMLESVSSNNSDGITYKTKYKYAKAFSGLTSPDSGKPDAVAMKSLNDNFRHGEMVESIQSRKEGAGTELITGASLTVYKDFGSGQVLPHKTFEFPPKTGFAETSFSGSPQKLTIALSYRLMTTVQSYNSIGMPLSILDYRKKKSGVHYGYVGTTPMATVENAYAEETAYSSFESSSGFSLTLSGGANSDVAGWTGAHGRSILSSTIMRLDNMQKGVGKYRFSCWVKSSNTPTITFKAMNGVTVQSSGTVAYSGAGQWQYREALLDMTSVGNTFSLEVVSSAATEIDDIRFYPANASMSTLTQQRLTGVTSASDDRGISTFTEYDELGRVRYVKDRNKNIIQVTDYRYREEIPPALTSNFTSDESGNVHEDEDIHFTAPTNCGGVNYTWKVDNVQVGTSSTLTHAFAQKGYHTVELTVSSTSGSVSTTKSYCTIPPATGTLRMVPNNGGTIYKCDANHTVNVEVDGINGCGGAESPYYVWSFKPASSNDWFVISGNGPDISFNIATAYGLQSFQLKCELQPTLCPLKDTGDDSCDGKYPFSASKTISFTYVDNSPCL